MCFDYIRQSFECTDKHCYNQCKENNFLGLLKLDYYSTRFFSILLEYTPHHGCGVYSRAAFMNMFALKCGVYSRAAFN